MDFTKRTALTPDENREISELLHYAVLTELFDATQWRANQVVFHGGTSLRVARSSDRYSEDLDFLVSPEVTEDLGEAMEKVRDGILVRLALRLPGSNITVKQAKGKEGSLVTGFTSSTGFRARFMRHMPRKVFYQPASLTWLSDSRLRSRRRN